MFCSKCGTQLDDGAKFCGKCGNATAHDATSETSESDSKSNPETKTFDSLRDNVAAAAKDASKRIGEASAAAKPVIAAAAKDASKMIGEASAAAKPVIAAAAKDASKTIGKASAAAFATASAAASATPSNERKRARIIIGAVVIGLLVVTLYLFGGGAKNAGRASEATKQKESTSKYPFYAVITCGLNGQHINVLACFNKTEIELTNGTQYGLYKVYEIQRLGNETRQGFVIDLQNDFSIKLQNSNSSLTLGLKIYKTGSNETVFQKQVAQYGVINVSN